MLGTRQQINGKIYYRYSAGKCSEAGKTKVFESNKSEEPAVPYSETKEKRRDRKWQTLMRFGASTGCHQMPERSFFLFGYQFPVCARCTGVFLGNVLGFVLFFAKGFSMLAALAGCLAMLTDWLLQRLHIAESTNVRRFLTGIAGGFGVISLELQLLKTVYCKLFT